MRATRDNQFGWIAEYASVGYSDYPEGTYPRPIDYESPALFELPEVVRGLLVSCEAHLGASRVDKSMSRVFLDRLTIGSVITWHLTQGAAVLEKYSREYPEAHQKKVLGSFC